MTDNELLLIENGDGILAIGSDESLDAWQASAGAGGTARRPEAPVSLDLSRVARELPDLVDRSGVLHSRFLRGVPSVSAPSGQGVPELRLLTRDATGRFTSNTLVDSRVLAAINPQFLLISAVLEVALSELGEIRRELEDVREGVNELLHRANAEKLGDVYGRNVVLRRMVHAINSGDRLSTADWESIAAMGPELQIGTEKLRRYIDLSLVELNAGDSPAKRARKLGRLLDTGRFIDHLKLLVVAEESLALYHRLRLERVRSTEDEALGQTVRSITAILEANLEADLKLGADIRQVLDDVAVLHSHEGFDVINRRRLSTLRAELRSATEEFMAHRSGQAEQWELSPMPGARDALRYYRARAHDTQDNARTLTARGLEALAARIRPTREEPGD